MGVEVAAGPWEPGAPAEGPLKLLGPVLEATEKDCGLCWYPPGGGAWLTEGFEA